ncbi:hypothetical protein Leryth_022534, partial [Lithospermum erythrorhizon]
LGDGGGGVDEGGGGVDSEGQSFTPIYCESDKLPDERQRTNVLRRPDISQGLKTLKCRTLIFIGNNSPFHLEALHMIAKLDKRYSVLVECGGRAGGGGSHKGKCITQRKLLCCNNSRNLQGKIEEQIIHIQSFYPFDKGKLLSLSKGADKWKIIHNLF